MGMRLKGIMLAGMFRILRAASMRSVCGKRHVHTAPSPSAWAARRMFSEAAARSCCHRVESWPGRNFLELPHVMIAMGALAAILAYGSASASWARICGSSISMNSQGCAFTPDGALIAAARIACFCAGGMGRSEYWRILVRLRMLLKAGLSVMSCWVWGESRLVFIAVGFLSVL